MVESLAVLDVVHFVRIRIDHFCIHSRFRQTNSNLFEALFPSDFASDRRVCSRDSLVYLFLASARWSAAFLFLFYFCISTDKSLELWKKFALDTYECKRTPRKEYSEPRVVCNFFELYERFTFVFCSRSVRQTVSCCFFKKEGNVWRTIILRIRDQQQSYRVLRTRYLGATKWNLKLCPLARQFLTPVCCSLF